MSLLLPRRVDELPPLESESEDELKTPIKSEMNIFKDGPRLKPKRVHELPPLEPDSEDDNFNECAILNDSFVLSNDEEEEQWFTGHSNEKKKENNKNIPNTDQCDNAKNKLISKPPRIDSIVSQTMNLHIGDTDAKKKSFPISNGPLKGNTFKSTIEQPKYRPINMANSILNPDRRKEKCGSLSIFKCLSKPNQNEMDTKSNIQSVKSLSVAKENQLIDEMTEEISKTDLKKSPATLALKKIQKLEKNPMLNSQNKTKKTKNQPNFSQSFEIKNKNSSPLSENSLQRNSADGKIETVTVTDAIQTPQIKLFGGGSSMSGRRQFQQPLSTLQKTRPTFTEMDLKSQKILFTTPTPTPISRPLSTLQSQKYPTPISLANISVDLALNESFNPKKLETVSESPMQPNLCSYSNDEVLKMTSTELFSFGANSKSFSTNANERRLIEINGNNYVLGKKLGSGASSSVFLAHKNGDGKEYALKIVNLQSDPIVVEGYINETKLLAKLQGNDSVIKLFEYEHNQNNSTLFMVMEKGACDFHNILQTYNGSIPLYELIPYWHQMLQSVDYIHQHGVIHLDLKPANFLMVNGRLKLIDFGIASSIATDVTSIIKHNQAGTFNYISPEALVDTSSGCSPTSGQPKIRISTKSDVWSLGCILYLLLYKKTPFADIKKPLLKVTAITNPATKIDYPTLPMYYPPMLLEMVQKCLRYNAKERPAVSDLLKYPFYMVIKMSE